MQWIWPCRRAPAQGFDLSMRMSQSLNMYDSLAESRDKTLVNSSDGNEYAHGGLRDPQVCLRLRFTQELVMLAVQRGANDCRVPSMYSTRPRTRASLRTSRVCFRLTATFFLQLPSSFLVGNLEHCSRAVAAF